MSGLLLIVRIAGRRVALPAADVEAVVELEGVEQHGRRRGHDDGERDHFFERAAGRPAREAVACGARLDGLAIFGGNPFYGRVRPPDDARCRNPHLAVGVGRQDQPALAFGDQFRECRGQMARSLVVADTTRQAGVMFGLKDAHVG